MPYLEWNAHFLEGHSTMVVYCVGEYEVDASNESNINHTSQ